MAGVHSRFSPSSLYLTMACPGSVKLRQQVPPEADSPESIEGTVAHHVAMMLALGTPMKEGDKHMDVEVDEPMIDGAELWVNTVGANGAFEMPVMCPDIHNDCWGTPDFWSWDATARILTVWDYKYGHRYVEEFENIQLAAYASGLIRMLGLPADTVVQLGIVQPRCYMAKQVRQWVTNVAKIMEMAMDIRLAVQAALSDEAVCRTGSHCIDCPARGICKTLQYASNQTLQFVQVPELVEQTPQALGVELTLLSAAEDLIKARRKALSVIAEAAIRNGQNVPGWELKPGRSNLQWKDPDKVVDWCQSAGISLYQQPKLITPTQALSKKLVDQNFIDLLSSRPPAAMKLSPVSTVTTRKIFGA